MPDHTGELNLDGATKAAAARRLSEWFAAEPGATLANAENEVIGAHLANLFGYNLLQVGGIAGVDLLASSRVLHRTVVDIGDGIQAPACDSVLRCSASALAVESDCVDVVVLPHVLEFVTRPHEALREAARVLIPDGHLVITTLNPLSLMGIWRMALARRCDAPWNGRFMTLRRTRDWLELLGFEVMEVSALFFRPPVGRRSVLGKTAILDRVGERVCPLLAGCHVILARKRVAAMTPIRTRFAYPRRLVGVSLAGPPARVSNEE